ncbi:MAG: pseudouridine synthase [Xanthomonadales bacterium]|nr:pseudouridine synthase [Xanthomonadales bacterium]
MSERVQKVLARAGAGSRRKLEGQIEAGRVFVNGKRAKLGAQVRRGDLVELGDQRYKAEIRREPTRVMLFNKPEGVVCTRSDPEGRPTVFDQLPSLKGGRWITIGRLDINTTGLLLLTNDGELANKMMHPRYGVDREYACRVHGEVTEAMIQALLAGVKLEDGVACFSDIVDSGGSGENRWFHVALMEGRNREVRRLWESQGVQVSRLKRVRYGAVFLPSRLKMGDHEEMAPEDVKVLREDVGLPGVPDPELYLKPVGGRPRR